MNPQTSRIVQLFLSLLAEAFQVLGQTKIIKPVVADAGAGVAGILLQAFTQSPTVNVPSVPVSEVK